MKRTTRFAKAANPDVPHLARLCGWQILSMFSALASVVPGGSNMAHGAHEILSSVRAKPQQLCQQLCSSHELRPELSAIHVWQLQETALSPVKMASSNSPDSATGSSPLPIGAITHVAAGGASLTRPPFPIMDDAEPDFYKIQVDAQPSR